MLRKIIRHAGHLYRQAAVQIPEHLADYLVVKADAKVPDDVLNVAIVAAQNAYDWEQSQADNTGRPHGCHGQAVVRVTSSYDHEKYGDAWFAPETRSDPMDVPPMFDVWSIGDNQECDRSAFDIVYNPTKGWSYQDHYFPGPYKPLNGVQEALVVADVMFHG